MVAVAGAAVATIAFGLLTVLQFLSYFQTSSSADLLAAFAYLGFTGFGLALFDLTNNRPRSQP